MRHKTPIMCSVRAFGMYLFYRFSMSGEMDDANRPDFTKNEDWFWIKTLTDCTIKNNKKEMKKRSYTEMIKECFRMLLIYSAHFGHFGRVGAPPLMELEEVPPDYIRILGTFIRLLFFTCSTVSTTNHVSNSTLFLQETGTQTPRSLDTRPRCPRLRFV